MDQLLARERRPFAFSLGAEKNYDWDRHQDECPDQPIPRRNLYVTRLAILVVLFVIVGHQNTIS